MLQVEQILKLIRERVDHPATVRELQQMLRVPKEARGAFKRQLTELVASGDLIEVRGERYGLPDLMNLIVGTISTNPRGFAFVDPDDVDGEDAKGIFIAGNNLNQAMHGDRVVVRVERDGARPEGRIVRILERASQTIVGRFDVDGTGAGFVVPFDRRVMMDVQVDRAETLGAKKDEMVTVEITRWPTAARPAAGKITEVLGPLDAPGVDTAVIIKKHNLPDEHGAEAVEEAKRIGSQVREHDLAGRTDFRPITTVTIDGETARDFDDAITIRKLPNGNFWLGVHIADVSHYVRPGSKLDEEAYERSTSVYFPERAVHMFPSELSTGMCSLNPKVDRLVQSCLMEVDKKNGHVLRYEMHDGVINSNERMTYNQVNAILTDKDPAMIARYEPLVPMFEAMRELFEVLNARRRRRGSIDFDLKESQIVLDDQGMVEAIVASERNIAHRLIEEFMLLANETVARHLQTNFMPTLYRVHEEPDPMKVEQFEEFIGSLGYSLSAHGEDVLPRDFQRLVSQIAGKPEERPIAFLMLRTMQRARYDQNNLGHFGLAAEFYTHFTSPIRRYPDLVVHRSLREMRKGVSAERKAELAEDLPDMAKHTSERERRAADAERELVQWKKVRFMADKVGDEFEGYVTGVSAFGLFIELIEHFVEGMVHVSTMADDYYRFIEKSHLLKGEKNGRVYRLGDKVRVQVIRVDMERRQIDLGLAEILDAVRLSERNRGPRTSRVKMKKEGRRRKQRPGQRERAFGKAAKRRR
ncbi:MAG: ribonuclease R [Acidobacteria bacterium]|nr:MAG: ribonuclease R [Acidobacteriota bacterium]